MESGSGEITALLNRLAGGDRSAEEALLPLVYVELHRLAVNQLRRERTGHTLQPTALVHEVYLRLCGQQPKVWKGRAHFSRLAARMMRQILIDYARQRNAQKRGDGKIVPLIDNAHIPTDDQLATVLEVDELLTKLAEFSPRQAQVVELRFFGGLSLDEIAEIVGVNTRTVKRDWLAARAWLHEKIQER